LPLNTHILKKKKSEELFINLCGKTFLLFSVLENKVEKEKNATDYSS
jgi:hypothetical protein